MKLTHSSAGRLHCVLLETEPTRWGQGPPSKSVRKPQPRQVVLPGIRQLVGAGGKIHMHTFSLPSINCIFCIIVSFIHSFTHSEISIGNHLCAQNYDHGVRLTAFIRNVQWKMMALVKISRIQKPKKSMNRTTFLYSFFTVLCTAVRRDANDGSVMRSRERQSQLTTFDFLPCRLLNFRKGLSWVVNNLHFQTIMFFSN